MTSLWKLLVRQRPPRRKWAVTAGNGNIYFYRTDGSRLMKGDRDVTRRGYAEWRITSWLFTNVSVAEYVEEGA
jgi:hypothetical protein